MRHLSNCLGCTILLRYKPLLLLLAHHLIKCQEHVMLQILSNLKHITSLSNESQTEKNKDLYSRGSIPHHLGLSAKVKSLAATIHEGELWLVHVITCLFGFKPSVLLYRILADHVDMESYSDLFTLTQRVAQKPIWYVINLISRSEWHIWPSTVWTKELSGIVFKYILGYIRN